MGIVQWLGGLLRRRTDCPHVEGLGSVTPSSPDQCLQCVEMGDDWVNLRICLICGQVGCCDNSKNTHATKHFHASGHPVIQSYQPGEAWRYCYVDDQMLEDGHPFRG